MKIKQLSLLAALVLALAACGGDSDDSSGGIQYSGNTSAATISNSNQQDIATASKSSIQNSLGGGDLPAGIEVTEIAAIQEITDALIQAAPLGNLPTGAQQTVNCDISGSATVDTGANNSTTSYTITYNNCSYDGEYFITGTVYVTSNQTGTEFSYRYDNVSVTGPSGTVVINATVECTNNGLTCTYSYDFNGSDGRVYRSSSVDVSGNNSTGYSVSATVYDPDHGYVTMTSSGIVLCSDGSLSEGSVTVTDGTNNTLTIDFPQGCPAADMQVSLNGGGSVTYSQ